MFDQPKQYYSLRDIAKLTGKTYAQIKYIRVRLNIKVDKIGRSHVVPRDKLRLFMNELLAEMAN